MTTLYLIRHAEAEGNVYRRCQGQYDSLLTARAYEQLACLAKRFAEVPLSAVYASDLFRARTTAKAVAEPHGLSVQLNPALREISMGEWEDLTWAELPLCDAEGFAAWGQTPWCARPPKGETMYEAGARMLNCAKQLAAQHRGEQIAVVTHGSAIRGALTIAEGLPPEKMGEIGWGDNTSVTCIECEDDGSLRVVYQNDASHLEQSLSTFAAIGWKDSKDIPQTVQIWHRPFEAANENDSTLLQKIADERGLLQGDLSELVGAAQAVDPLAVTVGCLTDGTPTALTLLCPQTEPMGKIALFYVLPDYRACNLPVQQLGHAVSLYRGRGAEQLWLAPTEDAQTYLALGFVHEGEKLILPIAVPPADC